MSEIQWAHEVASGCNDGGRHTRRIGTGGFVGARSPETQESAFGTALVAVSDDASAVNERRVLRDVALAFAGADAHVYPRGKKMGCD